MDKRTADIRAMERGYIAERICWHVVGQRLAGRTPTAQSLAELGLPSETQAKRDQLNMLVE